MEVENFLNAAVLSRATLLLERAKYTFVRHQAAEDSHGSE